MSEVTIIMPAGMDGAWEGDAALDAALRQIAERFGDAGDWPGKYGAWVDNAVFQMHPFCWCEEDACPWCVSCSCPDDRVYSRRWIGEREVSEAEWADAGGYTNPQARRRMFVREEIPACEFCRTGGPAALKGGGPERNAPNFWFKPTGLRVWWYKWIGRDPVVEPLATPAEVAEMLRLCLEQAP